MKNTILLILLGGFTAVLTAQDVDLVWVKKTEASSGANLSTGIYVDDIGSVFTTGYFQYPVDFIPGPGNLTLTPQALIDSYLRKMDGNGNLLWVNQYSCTDRVYISELQSDGLGNLYISGTFRGSVDVDPGPGTQTYSSLNSNRYNAFVQKLDTAGNIKWTFPHLSNGDMGAPIIRVDSLGNLYLIGSFEGSVDFHPSPSVTDIKSSGWNREIYIQKLDSNLNPLWFRTIPFVQFASVGYSHAVRSVRISNSGNLYLLGRYSGAIDINTDPGMQQTIVSVGGADAYLLKLDSNGNFDWYTTIEGNAISLPASIQLNAAEEITTIGYLYDGTADLDPGPGVLLSNPQKNLLYFQRQDSSGNLLWTKTIDDSVTVSYGGFELDNQGNLYVTGQFTDTVDFEPGPGIQSLVKEPYANPPGYPNIYNWATFIAKYTPDAQLQWVKQFRYDNLFSPRPMFVDNNNFIYQADLFYFNVDFDPSEDSLVLTTTGIVDGFVMKLSQSNGPLNVLIDQASDISCTTDGFASVMPMAGTAPYTYSWNTNPVITDSIATFTNPGIYSVAVTDSNGFTYQGSVLIGGPSTASAPAFEANLNASTFRTGFPAIIWVDASNTSCAPYSGGLTLTLDPLVTYDSASVAPDTIIGNNLIWYMNQMNADSGHFLSKVYVTTSLQAMIGDQVCLDLFKGVINPIAITSIPATYCYDVLNSYDPNDKQVYPNGNCPANYVKIGEPLIYTVRFQNTGNADAINVYIIDSLSQNLDINTVRIVAQSHDSLITEVLENNTLKFRFDHIYLADSSTDAAASQGFVSFEVHPKTNLANNQLVENNAEIYFDFNAPIITNTTHNTFTNLLPSIDTSQLKIRTCDAKPIINGRVYEQGGQYYQHLSDQQGCDSVVLLKLTIVELDASTRISGDTLWAASQNASTYQWINCATNQVINGANSAYFIPSQSGMYSVQITKDGCSKTSDCASFWSVSIEGLANQILDYYPNPTKDKVHIVLGQKVGKIQVKVVNQLGQELAHHSYQHKDQLSVPLPVNEGVYFIHLILDGQKEIIKVLKL